MGEAPALPCLLALALHAKTQGPVSILRLADTQRITIQHWGKVTDSTAEAGISKKTLAGISSTKAIFDYYRSPAELRDALADFETALGDWKLHTRRAFGGLLKTIAFSERAKLWACPHACIEGDRIVATHPEIKAPKAPRHQWLLETGYEGNL